MIIIFYTVVFTLIFTTSFYIDRNKKQNKEIERLKAITKNKAIKQADKEEERKRKEEEKAINQVMMMLKVDRDRAIQIINNDNKLTGQSQR